MSRLTVKNIKSVQNPATGFNAYTASVYFDGKLVGTVENRGNGGCASFCCSDQAVYQDIAAWTKDNPVSQEEVTFSTPEDVLDYLVERTDVEKGIRSRLKRSFKTGIMFTPPGGATELSLSIKAAKGQTFEGGFAWIEKNHPGSRIFNKEPLEDVVAHFMKLAGY